MIAELGRPSFWCPRSLACCSGVSWYLIRYATSARARHFLEDQRNELDYREAFSARGRHRDDAGGAGISRFGSDDWTSSRYDRGRAGRCSAGRDRESHESAVAG